MANGLDFEWDLKFGPFAIQRNGHYFVKNTFEIQTKMSGLFFDIIPNICAEK